MACLNWRLINNKGDTKVICSIFIYWQNLLITYIDWTQYII